MKYEKIICLNVDNNFNVDYDNAENMLIIFAKDKCKKDKEKLMYYTVERAKLISDPMSPPQVAFSNNLNLIVNPSCDGAVRILWEVEDKEML